jgi:hypothetical protein
MRAVWFIGKFQLVLNCNNYENQTSKSRTSQTRKTLCASGFEHSNNHDNLDEKHLISLTILTNEMTNFFAAT